MHHPDVFHQTSGPQQAEADHRGGGETNGQRRETLSTLSMPVLRVRDTLAWGRFLSSEAGGSLLGLLVEGLAFSYVLTHEIMGSRLPFVEELLRKMEHSRRRFASRHEAAAEDLRSLEQELYTRRSRS